MTVDGTFIFEDCLLKHHIRRHAWLPLCKERLRLLRAGRPQKRQRRLRYFTFCAVGAIDVHMLEMARVLRKSGQDRFDSVFFFDRTPELIVETARRIPGANGFPGDFVSIVLADDPQGDDPDAALDPPATDEDTRTIRAKQLTLNTRRLFVSSFPFDVINLDLEGFFFRPSDPLPGRLVNVMRRVFQWQTNELRNARGVAVESITGFSLMFTTQIGPRNLGDDYRQMLRGYVQGNVDRRPDLVDRLESRTGTRQLDQIEGQQFDTYFKLAAPKLLASILDEQDWYIERTPGIKTYEIERASESGPYKMLHMVMQVSRKSPPRANRAPGQDSPVARDAYDAVVEGLFSGGDVQVSDSSIDQAALKSDLDAIKARRSKVYLEGEATA